MLNRRQYLQSLGGLTAVGSGTTPALLGGFEIASSDTLTPLASEWGELLFPDVSAADVPTYGSQGNAAWAITYADEDDDSAWDALESRIDSRDDLEQLTHLEDSQTVFLQAPDGEIGVGTLDRLLGNGLQAMSGIERIDLVVTHERPEPVTSMLGEDDFEQPGWFATRGETLETTGIAFEADETTTLRDARENLGVEAADIPPLADLETVKVGVVDTGINVDNGLVWGRGARFSPIRIPAAKDFSGDGGSEADVVIGRVRLEHISDSDFNDGEFTNFLYSSSGDDATLALDLDDTADETQAEYTGAIHTLEDADRAFVDLTLDLADATVTLEGRDGDTDDWSEALSETVNETGEFEYDLGSSEDYVEWRWHILIDTGTDGSDATGEIHAEGLESPEQILNDDSDWSAVADGDGHGSWCGAAIAADPDDRDYRGIAADAPVDLYVAKALADDGSGSTQSIVEAIAWMREQDVDVINLSLGSQLYNETIDDEVGRFLENGGSAVVAAAGNDRQVSRWLNSPADSEHTIAVAATTNEPAEDAQVGYFSNVGPSDGLSNMSDGETRGNSVDVAAPGIDVEARYPSTTGILTERALTGTSMASPKVAGLVALLLAVEPSLKGDYEAVKERLKETAEPIPAAGKTEVGVGMPQADRLLADDRDGADQSEVVELPASTRDAANKTMTGSLFGGD